MIWLSSFVGQVENLRLQRRNTKLLAGSGYAITCVDLPSFNLTPSFLDKINEPSRREKEKGKKKPVSATSALCGSVVFYWPVWVSPAGQCVQLRGGKRELF